jgi:hypothetical protein
MFTDDHGWSNHNWVQKRGYLLTKWGLAQDIPEHKQTYMIEPHALYPCT